MYIKVHTNKKLYSKNEVYLQNGQTMRCAFKPFTVYFKKQTSNIGQHLQISNHKKYSSKKKLFVRFSCKKLYKFTLKIPTVIIQLIDE